MYKVFKTEFGKEIYLNMPFESRRIICRFRCRNLYLPASPKVYFTQSSSNIVCPLCQLNATGNELHYITDCPALSQERLSLPTSNDKHSCFVKVMNDPSLAVNLTKLVISLSQKLTEYCEPS